MPADQIRNRTVGCKMTDNEYERLTSVTDAAAHVTQCAYDTENNLLSITDANLHTTNFSYDAFGRVTQTVFPSNLFETYAYDADNNSGFGSPVDSTESPDTGPHQQDGPHGADLCLAKIQNGGEKWLHARL